jgi:hypothetical protein
MRQTLLARLLAALVLVLPPLLPALAQTAEPAPQPPGLADLPTPGVDTAECAWLGQRILVLLWRDDIDTANRFFTTYDRFGCPMGHAGLAFRCLVQLGAGEGEGDPGLPERAAACWENPALDPASLMPPQAPPVEGGEGTTGEQPKSN